MHTVDRFRPLYHFAPAANWINDPNGLVYYAGEYHLFFQYHPHSTLWGPMHWGHAVSTDLIHWQELPVALYPDELGAIFSGSAVIDWHNTAGFGRETMVAVFTHHVTDGHRQSQSLAYSHDRGRTWIKYAGNPVIPTPPGLRDFRDPKVFWHGSADDGHWVMCLAAGREIQFYTAPNLRDWTYSGSFGAGYGGATGVWETPDLFELPVAGADATAWVLTVGMGDGAPAGGSGTQYFVGHFDGNTFTSANSKETVLWADYGPDFYAAQSWSDTPDGRRLVIGWMNNWTYARQLPTQGWRGAMTFPRAVGLVATEAGPRLTQRPAVALADTIGHCLHRDSNVEITLDAPATVALHSVGALQLDVRLHVGPPQVADVIIQFGFGEHDWVALRYNGADATLEVDRRRAGMVDFHEAFPGCHYAPLTLPDSVLDIQVLIDSSSVEVFTRDGRLAVTACIFPRAPLSTVIVSTAAQPMTLASLQITQLDPHR